MLSTDSPIVVIRAYIKSPRLTLLLVPGFSPLLSCYKFSQSFSSLLDVVHLPHCSHV
jgi:hypothetical protein